MYSTNMLNDFNCLFYYVFCICCWPHGKLLITVAEFHWTFKNLHVFFQSSQNGGEQQHNLKWLTFTRRSCSPHAMFFSFFPPWHLTLGFPICFSQICWDTGSASCFTDGQPYLCDRWVGLGIELWCLYGTNQIATMLSSIKKWLII